MGKDNQDLWYCCRCNHYWSYTLYAACVNCHHRRDQCCLQRNTTKRERQTGHHEYQQSPPASQTRHQTTARGSTPDSHGSSVHKATGGGLLSTPDTTLQNTSAPEKHKTVHTGFNTRLELPDHLYEESTVAQQLELFCEVSNDSTNLMIHRTLTRDSGKAIVSFMASSVLTAVEPSANPFKGLTTPPKRWLETSAKAGTSPLHLTCSSMLVEASYKKGNSFDRGTERRTSVSKIESPFVLSNNAKADEEALLHATGNRQSDLCHVNPRLQDCFLRAASHSPRDVTRSTCPSIELTNKQGTHQSEDADNLAARIYGLFTSADPFREVNRTILCVLMQILYSALYFDPSGTFRSCDSGKPSTQSTNSRHSQKASQRPRKRRLESARDSGSDDCGGDDSEAGRSKRWKANDVTLQEDRRRFACLHCKNRLSYGDELKCAGWSNPNIDTVLRRHLNKHVGLGHLSEAKYLRVRELMRVYGVSKESKREELWKAAYMEVFDVQPDKVPSPYYDSAALESIPNLQSLIARIMDRISEDITLPVQLRTFVAANAALDRDRDAGRQRLRERFLTREARLIEENHARQEAAEREHDAECDARQLYLNMQIEIALGPEHRSEDLDTQFAPREAVGTTTSCSHGPPHSLGPVSANQWHTILSDRSSSRPQQYPSFTPTSLPNLPAPDVEHESVWTSSNTMDHSSAYLPVHPLPMDTYDLENDIFFEVAARQTLLPIAATSSSNEAPGDNSRSPSGSPAHPSADSRDGVSYTPCGSCGKICQTGQDSCDTCADIFETGLYP